MNILLKLQKWANYNKFISAINIYGSQITHKKETEEVILYFNPPFSKNEDIIRQRVLEVCKVGLKNSSLNKIFNKITIKLSYSCLPNMKVLFMLTTSKFK